MAPATTLGTIICGHRLLQTEPGMLSNVNTIVGNVSDFLDILDCLRAEKRPRSSEYPIGALLNASHIPLFNLGL